jgi:integrase
MGRPRYQKPSVGKTAPKLGRARWYVRVMVDVLVNRNQLERKEKTIYLGFCDEMGKRQAEKERDRQLAAVNNTPLVVQSQVKFADVVAAYKDTVLPGMKPSGRHSTGHCIDKNILPAFKDLALFEIDPIKVQKWVYAMEDRKLAKSTRALNLCILRTIFENAELWGYFQGRNPCKLIKLGSGGEVFNRRALTPDEARNLIAVLEEPLRLIVETALFTGLRVSELMGLTWEAIDHTGRALIVKQGKSQQGDLADPKTRKGRRSVPLGGLTDRFIRPAHAGAADLIWPGVSYSGLQHQLTWRASKLGITFQGFGWHTLRRTYATFRHLLGASSEPSRALVAAMGHTNGGMTALYIREEQDVVDKLRDLVFFSGVVREKSN